MSREQFESLEAGTEVVYNKEKYLPVYLNFDSGEIGIWPDGSDTETIGVPYKECEVVK